MTLITTLADAAAGALRDVIGDARECALVDYPHHSNPGDSGIWLGERALLARVGVRVRYACSLGTFSATRMRAAVPDGPVLLHGGGNLGDIWPGHQTFREQVIEAFPDRRVVVLAQTLRFEDPHARARAVETFDAHPHLTILVRDQTSLDTARRLFAAPSVLVPDPAFALGPQRRARPEVPVVWLLRRDLETRVEHRHEARTVDWLESPHSGRTGLIPRVAVRMAELGARRAGWLEAPRVAAYDRLARHHVRRGCGLLARGSVVVTDRLHGHIFCLLMGIPHVVVDTGYGKLAGFYEAWTASSPLVHWASDLAEAGAIAERLTSSDR